MSITYDPDETPDVDAEHVKYAREMGMFVINVICEEPDEELGDDSGMGFVAYVYAVPRIGERIVLQDGHAFDVTNVHHKVVTMPKSGFIAMMPNVVGRRVG